MLRRSVSRGVTAATKPSNRLDRLVYLISSRKNYTTSVYYPLPLFSREKNLPNYSSLFFQTNVKILRDLTVQYINIHFNTSLPIKTLNRWKKCWNEIEDKDESEKYDTLER